MPEKAFDFSFGSVGSALVGGLAMFGWHLWRTRRNDGKQDDVADQFGKLVGIMQTMADEQTKRADEQSRRADQFAAERNDLQRQLGKLEASLEHIGAKADQLREQLEDERELVKSLAVLARHLISVCPGRLPSGLPSRVVSEIVSAEVANDAQG